MSYESLLIETCTVQRFTEGAVDVYGNPSITWDLTYIVDTPCRFSSPSGRELKIGAEIVIADYTLFLGDINITEQDRIEHGSNIYEILLVQEYSDSLAGHHKQCQIRISR